MTVQSRADAVAPEGAQETTRGEVSPAEFLNRELTWLEFNRRVLHQAIDERTPLLERARFLAIFTSNLDEFYMKRVGGLKRQIAAGVVSRTPDGRTPAEQLAEIRRLVLPMLQEQADVFRDEIRPKLAEAGVHLLRWDQLTDEERRTADAYFQANVFPVLTPLAVDPGHPFPFISNLSTSLGVALSYPKSDERVFARIKVPQVLPQWVRLDTDDTDGQFRFVSLIDIICNNIDDLFPEMTVRSMMPFRITRNADIERDEEDAEDLLELVEQELRQRRFEKIVRLEHGPAPDPWMRRFLMEELELTESDVYELPAELDFTDLNVVADLNLPNLKFRPWTPMVPPALADEETDIFSIIRAGDLLVHHPYESFTASVERFVRSAATDPKVLALKMTLYRTGDDSPFIKTLIRAAEAGKQVVCLIELKARFDEERNVQIAQALEKAGVHVVYGLVGYKTHTKTAMIVRQETDGLRVYAHIGTGNYHAGTAKLYTDLGLLTCKPAYGGELAQVFNYLTGRSMKQEYDKLLVAPVNMKRRFHEMIEREIEHAEAGRRAHIVAKMNSLEHRGICRSLYRASQAGVRIDLIVRGFCCLRPGVEGMSENIRVISIIGRFLEHSRVFYFRNNADHPVDGEFYIGSADWMYRNLLARVEAITPIEERPLRERLWELLTICLEDRRQAWEMHPDGSYTLRPPDPDADPNSPAALGTQETLMRLTQGRCAASTPKR
jgi:polyphosphate kinase